MARKTTSNTGAQTPMGEAEAAPTEEKKQETGEVLGFIDYISCTFPYRTEGELDDLRTFLGGNDWRTTSVGSNGYARGQRCGGISLWYAGRSDMGINLRVGGNGCRELEIMAVKQDWAAFIGKLLERGAKFARLDVAIDDQAGILNLSNIGQCCLEKQVIGRFKYIEPRTFITRVTGFEFTTGYVFGRRVSNTMIRIYDKALEQSKKGHHIRVELETKKCKAHELAKKLAESGEGIIAGVIAASLDFKVKGTDSHRHRWKQQEWWKEFLGEAEKIRLSTAPSNQSLERSIQILEYQYGTTMAMVLETYGESKLLEIARNGKARLQPRHFSLMALYKPYKRTY